MGLTDPLLHRGYNQLSNLSCRSAVQTKPFKIVTHDNYRTRQPRSKQLYSSSSSTNSLPITFSSLISLYPQPIATNISEIDLTQHHMHTYQSHHTTTLSPHLQSRSTQACIQTLDPYRIEQTNGIFPPYTFQNTLLVFSV
jgi:hypothetical protein